MLVEKTRQTVEQVDMSTSRWLNVPPVETLVESMIDHSIIVFLGREDKGITKT
jgi:hypothetical protein